MLKFQIEMFDFEKYLFMFEKRLRYKISQKHFGLELIRFAIFSI